METPCEITERATVPMDTFKADGDEASELFEQMKSAGINRLHVDVLVTNHAYQPFPMSVVTLTRVEVEYCDGHTHRLSGEAIPENPGERMVPIMGDTALAEVHDLLEELLQTGLGDFDGALCEVTVDPWAKTIDGRGDITTYRHEPIRFTYDCSSDIPS